MRTRHLRGQFFGGLGAVLRQDLGNRVREFEAPAVGRKPSASISPIRARRCFSRSSSRDKKVSLRGKRYYKALRFQPLRARCDLHLHHHPRV